jgi:hypothetical protein
MVYISADLILAIRYVLTFVQKYSCKSITERRHSHATLVILIAECADMVKYQTSSSTRLGPSDRVANVSILDTAYASGNEAHDNVTVSNFSKILVTDVISNVVDLNFHQINAQLYSFSNNTTS